MVQFLFAAICIEIFYLRGSKIVWCCNFPISYFVVIHCCNIGRVRSWFSGFLMYKFTVYFCVNSFFFERVLLVFKCRKLKYSFFCKTFLLMNIVMIYGTAAALSGMSYNRAFSLNLQTERSCCQAERASDEKMEMEEKLLTSSVGRGLFFFFLSSNLVCQVGRMSV